MIYFATPHSCKLVLSTTLPNCFHFIHTFSVFNLYFCKSQAFTMEILRHKDIIDELVKSGHKIMTTCSEEEKQSMKV